MKKSFLLFPKKIIGFKGIQIDKSVNFFIPREYLSIHENNYIFSNKKKEFILENSITKHKRYNSFDKIRKPNFQKKLKPVKDKIISIQNNKKFNFNNLKKIFNREEEKDDIQLSIIPRFNTFGTYNYCPSISSVNNNFLYLLNPKKPLQKDENYVKLFGIKNIGYSCYINSFLQILLRTPFFYKNLQKVNNSEKIALIKCLIDLINNSQKGQIIKKIKILMSNIDETYEMQAQNDSQDFGINLINYLIILLKGENSFDDEKDNDDIILNENIPIFDIEKYKNSLFKEYLDKYYKKENEIFIEKMFQFHESKLLLEVNDDEQKIYDAKKIYFETSISIDLNFQKENIFVLKDLLLNRYPEFHNFYKGFSELEKDEINWEVIKEKIYKMYRDFMEFCFSNYQEALELDEDGNNIRKGKKSFCFRRLASLPNVLILSINRAFVGKSLNNSCLYFDETLDLKDFIDEDICKDEDTTYSLYAINECKGLIKNFGHYYSYVKINNKWFKFDDETIYEEKPKFFSKYVVGLYYIKNNFKL